MNEDTEAALRGCKLCLSDALVRIEVLEAALRGALIQLEFLSACASDSFHISKIRAALKQDADQ